MILAFSIAIKTQHHVSKLKCAKKGSEEWTMAESGSAMQYFSTDETESDAVINLMDLRM